MRRVLVVVAAMMLVGALAALVGPLWAAYFVGLSAVLRAAWLQAAKADAAHDALDRLRRQHQRRP